jgi:hypothetical protein
VTAFRAGHFRQASVAAATIVGRCMGGLRTALYLADAAPKVFLVAHTPDRGCGRTPPISPAEIRHNQHRNIWIGFRKLLREFPIEPPNISVTPTALTLATADV